MRQNNNSFFPWRSNPFLFKWYLNIGSEIIVRFFARITLHSLVVWGSAGIPILRYFLVACLRCRLPNALFAHRFQNYCSYCSSSNDRLRSRLPSRRRPRRQLHSRFVQSYWHIWRFLPRSHNQGPMKRRKQILYFPWFFRACILIPEAKNLKK